MNAVLEAVDANDIGRGLSGGGVNETVTQDSGGAVALARAIVVGLCVVLWHCHRGLRRGAPPHRKRTWHKKLGHGSGGASMRRWSAAIAVVGWCSTSVGWDGIVGGGATLSDASGADVARGKGGHAIPYIVHHRGAAGDLVAASRSRDVGPPNTIFAVRMYQDPGGCYDGNCSASDYAMQMRPPADSVWRGGWQAGNRWLQDDVWLCAWRRWSDAGTRLADDGGRVSRSGLTCVPRRLRRPDSAHTCSAMWPAELAGSGNPELRHAGESGVVFEGMEERRSDSSDTTAVDGCSPRVASGDGHCAHGLSYPRRIGCSAIQVSLSGWFRNRGILPRSYGSAGSGATAVLDNSISAGIGCWALTGHVIVGLPAAWWLFGRRGGVCYDSRIVCAARHVAGARRTWPAKALRSAVPWAVFLVGHAYMCGDFAGYAGAGRHSACYVFTDSGVAVYGCAALVCLVGGRCEGQPAGGSACHCRDVGCVGGHRGSLPSRVGCGYFALEAGYDQASDKRHHNLRHHDDHDIDDDRPWPDRDCNQCRCDPGATDNAGREDSQSSPPRLSPPFPPSSY